MKMIFTALSHGEPLLTIPFCFSSSVLFDPMSWSLTFGPAWNAPSDSDCDCRWCSWYEIQEHISDSTQESTEGKFHSLFSAAHHKGAAKMLSYQGAAIIVLAVEVI